MYFVLKSLKFIIIIYLSWSWATCWPVPVSRIQKSLQRSAMIPSASWGIACLKILFTLFRSTCFGHHCAHHQELLSCTCSLWSRVVIGSLCPPVLLCCNSSYDALHVSDTSVHHQELLSCTCSLWSRVVIGSLCPPVLLCCNCLAN